MHKRDVGSIIAYSLSTNYYYEGLARQNYMEFQSKFDQSSGEEININSKLNTAGKSGGSSNKGPQNYIEKKEGSGGFNGLKGQLNKAKKVNEVKKEQIRLNDRTDVLDSEYQPHHIESEFLSYEKINFKLKWCTNKKDMKMKIFKNIFKLDNIQGNIQEYCHKVRNIDEKVL